MSLEARGQLSDRLGSRAILGNRESRHQDRHEKGDDGDDDEHFQESEALLRPALP